MERISIDIENKIVSANSSNLRWQDFAVLVRCTEAIARDNNMNTKPMWLTTNFFNIDWHKLLEQAKRLPADKVETFCAGEMSEQDAICDDYKLGYLHNFLNSCFDGAFHDFVYQD
jgi:hypothetical protein